MDKSVLKIISPLSEYIVQTEENLDFEDAFNLTFNANNETGKFIITVSEPPNDELNPSAIAS